MCRSALVTVFAVVVLGCDGTVSDLDGGLGPQGGGMGTGGGAHSGGGAGVGGGGPATVLPAGWLYTAGNKVYAADGKGGGSVWVGRGANLDDVYLCGGAWATTAPEQTLKSYVTELTTNWKATFLRVSLGMNSFATLDWTGSYRTQMENVIRFAGASPDVYVLVTLRSHPSMTKYCPNSRTKSDAECMPSSETSMDATYRGLVNSFKDAKHVMFGVTNEPGGESASDQEIWDTMDHAVSVIRAEEDRLGVPHHLVAVQGNNWTCRLGFYNSPSGGKLGPLSQDGVVYEYHCYEPEETGTFGYTQSDIPVIIGEYGPLGTATLSDKNLFSKLESKSIPSLAWDFSPLSDCAPDLTTTDGSMTPTAWGDEVRGYLQSHAR